MSEQFYERFMALFFNFFIVLILVLVTTESILLFIITQNIIFYYAYLGMLMFDFFYFIKYYLQFRDFRETLSQGLLFPSNKESPSDLEPLETDGLEDVSLKVCLFYRNEASLNDIAKDFGFSHPTQAKRELIKGLDILLKSYEKHEKKVKLR